MTAPISVVRDPWCDLDRYPWRACCTYCGTLGPPHVSWDGAMWEAEQHANEPCDGIVLALLLERLKYLRDRRIYMQPEDLVTWGIKSEDHCRGWAAAQRQSGQDLAALIAEVPR